jgi:hypothetical protein
VRVMLPVEVLDGERGEIELVLADRRRGAADWGHHRDLGAAAECFPAAALATAGSDDRERQQNGEQDPQLDAQGQDRSASPNTSVGATKPRPRPTRTAPLSPTANTTAPCLAATSAAPFS